MKLKTPWYNFYDGELEHLDYPDISLYELIEENAQSHLDVISYNYFGKKVTYKKFLSQIDECAKALKMEGVKEGDYVSICMPNTPEAVIAFYATNKIGAIANMIHPLSSEHEIEHFINLTGSKIIITIDIAFNKINHIYRSSKLKRCVIVSAGDSMPWYMHVGYQLTQGRKVHLEEADYDIRWNDFIKNGKKYKKTFKSHFKGDKVAAILYSGGTTGYPKGIELTNLNFNALAMQSFEACRGLKERDSVLAIMPVFHGFGLGVCIHTAQSFGATSILLPQFSAKTFDKLLTKYKPNVIAGVPTLFEALLKNNNLDGVDLSFLKCVISGGDSLSINLKRKVDKFLKEHKANIQIREGYGLTECVTGSCLTPFNYYREGSIGIPYPDTYYKIVKPNTYREVAYGNEGEIIISGPTVMKGYLHEEEETKKTLRKDKDGRVWLYTGDMGFMDRDGFIYFKQRIKRMIISSGYCIYPQYIENTIDAVDEVLMSCVIGIPHPYKQEVAKAFIVLKPNIEATDEVKEKIKKHCEKELSKFSWPYEYEYRNELPKTLVGKIAYTKLIKEELEKNENK